MALSLLILSRPLAMKKLLVLYYSSYGHVEAMARHIAEGALTVEGVRVTVKRVPETLAPEVANAHHFKLDQAAPIATPTELAEYDGIMIGTPTRYGGPASQMRSFLEQTGPLWAAGALIGKLGSVFTSTGTGGGQETTITSMWPFFAHQGMLIAGLPYAAPELRDITEPRAGSPYGAATMAGLDGKRMPTAKEAALARFQGQHVARLLTRMH
jgi:NAD(P)H dehydrogenase (quinone)